LLIFIEHLLYITERNSGNLIWQQYSWIRSRKKLEVKRNLRFSIGNRCEGLEYIATDKEDRAMEQN
jgi:hypothetical protein